MAKPNFQFLIDNSTDLGKIRLEEDQVNVKFKDLFVPFSDSTGRVGLNVTGKLRVITLQGATDGEGYTGATIDLKLRDFVETIESWVNNKGVQEGRTYYDSLGRTFSVNCVDFTWRRSLSDPNRLLYTFILRQTV